MADILTADFVTELIERSVRDIVDIASELVDQLTDSRGFGPLHVPLSRHERVARFVMDAQTFVHKHLSVINPGEMSKRETQFLRDLGDVFAEFEEGAA